MTEADRRALDRRVDIYHAALTFLCVVHGQVLRFDPEQIVDGVPQRLALLTESVYAPALARALDPCAAVRTPTALEFWRELAACRP